MMLNLIGFVKSWLVPKSADENHLQIFKYLADNQGRDEELLLLQSSDGRKFLVAKAIGRRSNVINSMLELCEESENEEETLNDIKDKDTTLIPVTVLSDTLKVVLEWMTLEHKGEINNASAEETTVALENLIPADRQNLFHLINAANYLDVPDLLDVCCKRVADMIRGRSPAEICEVLGLSPPQNSD